MQLSAAGRFQQGAPRQPSLASRGPSKSSASADRLCRAALRPRGPRTPLNGPKCVYPCFEMSPFVNNQEPTKTGETRPKTPRASPPPTENDRSVHPGCGAACSGLHLCHHRVWHLPFRLRPTWRAAKPLCRALSLVRAQTAAGDPCQGKGLCSLKATRWLRLGDYRAETMSDAGPA